MSTNKKPHKHKPSINPVLMGQLEAKFKIENEKAKTAGVEYGILAIKIAAIMILNKHLNPTFSEKEKMINGFIEKINSSKEIIMNKKPIIDMIKDLQDAGYDTSLDDLVKIDPSLSQYF